MNQSLYAGCSKQQLFVLKYNCQSETWKKSLEQEEGDNLGQFAVLQDKGKLKLWLLF